MPVTNRGDSERKPAPAPFWTAPSQQPKAATPDPPITREILLPEKVAVKYLAEASGQDLSTVVALMRERIFVRVDRSVDFEDAAKILRRYGIAANREV